MARKFFSEKNRDHVIELFGPLSEEKEEKIRKVLGQVNTILRVMSSKRKVSSICKTVGN